MTTDRDDILEQSVRKAVRQPQVLEALATALEGQLIASMRADLGGRRDYFPMRTEPRRSARDETIRAAFTGNNHADLAKAHGISERHVYRIVQRKAPEKKN